MSIKFPNISPVAFATGPIEIKWYALAYMFGVLYGYFFISKKLFLNEKQKETLLMYGIAGVILGGRIAYVLFYSFAYFYQNPVEIIKIWHGGMSFHGGLAGVVLGFFFFAKKYRIDFLAILDVAACTAGVGIFFGRIANFVNAELYGNVTKMPWGVIFPAVGMDARHPTQIYEAILEGALLFAVLNFLFYFTNAQSYRGLLCGMSLCLYSVARIFIELFRQPDPQIGYVLDVFTMGQILSVPLLVLGAFLIIRSALFKTAPHKTP